MSTYGHYDPLEIWKAIEELKTETVHSRARVVELQERLNSIDALVHRKLARAENDRRSLQKEIAKVKKRLQLPEDLEEEWGRLKIRDLKDGELAYVVDWAFHKYVTPGGHTLIFIRGDYSCLESPFGTVNVPIIRREDFIKVRADQVPNPEKLSRRELLSPDWSWMQVILL